MLATPREFIADFPNLLQQSSTLSSGYVQAEGIKLVEKNVLSLLTIKPATFGHSDNDVEMLAGYHRHGNG